MYFVCMKHTDDVTNAVANTYRTWYSCGRQERVIVPVLDGTWRQLSRRVILQYIDVGLCRITLLIVKTSLTSLACSPAAIALKLIPMM